MRRRATSKEGRTLALSLTKSERALLELLKERLGAKTKAEALREALALHLSHYALKKKPDDFRLYPPTEKEGGYCKSVRFILPTDLALKLERVVLENDRMGQATVLRAAIETMARREGLSREAALFEAERREKEKEDARSVE